jgi:RNase H-like domain found in reverse transcriptase/Reverse transcriptase (RNA-dependent DNA polymerase)
MTVDGKSVEIYASMDPQCQGSHSITRISATQLKKVVRRKEPVYLVHLSQVGVKRNPAENSQLPNAWECILKEFEVVFPTDQPGLPPERSVAMEIDLEEGAKPVAKPELRLSPAEMDELKKQLSLLLEKELIRPSVSPWGAPVLFAPKKDGGLRMCLDYRALNQLTIKNKCPIPRIDENFDLLQGAQYFTSLDLRSGYYEIRMKDTDIPKTCIRTRYGSFEFLVMPFGLTNTPSTFQAVMNNVFREYLDDFVMVYIEDILIFSLTAEDHLRHVEFILARLRQHQLFEKLSKCEFNRASLPFLGHVVGQGGVEMQQSKVQALADWPRLTTVTEVQSFLGLANYYRRSIRDFARISAQLSELTKNGVPFEWGGGQENSFQNLKDAVKSAPVFQLADSSKPYIVTCDASDIGIGAVLEQEGEHGSHPVAFASRKLSNAEKNYPVHERELLAIGYALKEWRTYLHGSRFVVKTDQQPLSYLDTQSNLSKRQLRWMETLQEYDYEILYVQGKFNVVADALSRIN